MDGRGSNRQEVEKRIFNAKRLTDFVPDSLHANRFPKPAQLGEVMQPLKENGVDFGVSLDDQHVVVRADVLGQHHSQLEFLQGNEPARTRGRKHRPAHRTGACDRTQNLGVIPANPLFHDLHGFERRVPCVAES